MNTKIISLEKPFGPGLGEVSYDYNVINLTPGKQQPNLMVYERYLTSVARGRILSLAEYDTILDIRSGKISKPEFPKSTLHCYNCNAEVKEDEDCKKCKPHWNLILISIISYFIGFIISFLYYHK